MSDKKYTEDDPERTLITLDQLSQTIEVMTSVVNRLREHLSEQLRTQVEDVENPPAPAHPPVNLETTGPETTGPAQSDTENSEQAKLKKERFIVEISQQDAEPVRKQDKILH